MKKGLFIISTLLFFTGIKAQFAFDAYLYDYNMQGLANDSERSVKGYIVNTNGKTETVVWRITKNNWVNAWGLYVVDKDTTHDSTTTMGTIVLADGDSTVFELHVKPNQHSGSAKINVEIALQSNPFDIVDLEVNCDFSIINVTEITQKSVQVYPNPANNLLNITLPTSKPTVFEIYNSIGQKVSGGLYGEEPATIDISLLPDGIYYIRYSDDEGAIVSERFNKVQ